ncbi:glycosyltransferase family 4 protein [Gammaproteobacteria bacterium]|nr:glycosyltransferase family 4 protein [Gammaproteobacteria bacterium]
MLVFDGIIYKLQRRGGITVYFNELFRRLNNKKFPFTLIKYNKFESDLVKHFTISNPRIFERYRSINIPRKTKIFHSTYYRNPIGKHKALNVVTVHDFLYEKYSRWDKKKVHSFQKFRAIEKADAIICVSDQTKNDLLHYCKGAHKKSIFVIHNGVSKIFTPGPEVKSCGRPYLLYVGNRHGYKNFSLILSAMENLHDYDLYAVGGESVSKLEQRAINRTLGDRVFFFANVSDEQLVNIYRRAHCFVCSALDEGFGIPIAEAIASNCPVITLDRPIFREVAGSTGIFISNEKDDLVDKVLWLETNRKEHKRKILKYSDRFNWEKTHNKTIDVYRSLS